MATAGIRLRSPSVAWNLAAANFSGCSFARPSAPVSLQRFDPYTGRLLRVLLDLFGIFCVNFAAILQ